MTRVLTRAIPTSFPRALARTAPEDPIDVEVARSQHAVYRLALAACGATVDTLAADEECPDCCFVEDTAVIADGIALITRPGAPSRRAEIEPVARALAAHLEIVRMAEPGTLDGGDCMVVGDAIYVGRSARTNADGVAQLAAAFPRRRVVAIDLPAEILHLKCVCSSLGGDRMLLAEGALPASLFAATIVEVPADEAYAANAVALPGGVIVAAGFPRTHDALAAAGFEPYPVPVSEVRKADGALTCQSLLIDA